MKTILFRLRSLTRKLGLNPFIFKIIYWNQSYEKLFDNFLCSRINAGDCVYDIGANIGHYTKIFSTLVTNNGKVIAFEPSSINVKLLEKNTIGFSNVSILNIGIGAIKSKMNFFQGNDEIGATSRISNNTLDKNSEIISVETLNNIVHEHIFPNVIKIDVEGYELEVLKGANKILSSRDLRIIGIEIHAAILESNNILNPIQQIEEILINNGFKLKWTDFSHLVAFR